MSTDTEASTSLNADTNIQSSILAGGTMNTSKETLGDAGGEQRAVEGEEYLESDEVVEMHAFNDRKAWIEEKIKMLEEMPPIEAFAGLDAVRESAEEVPGLPTRAILEEWLREHDRIEKETDVFDTGELQKLRDITIAAAHRNMSPKDTDLIELTLNTILAVDRLLHLLRDRAENLETLGVRLTWEEKRIGAWVDRRNIIADLQTFLSQRARWSADTYNDSTILPLPTSPTPPPDIDAHGSIRRRGSTASLASVASFASEAHSLLTSPAFSRSQRFKLAEILSRDAANFATRVTTMRHGKVTSAGKVLDKLIERTQVPDELLDEQDRIEDMAEKEMEGIGKFAMSVVVQWKKADEFYVETLKDELGAQAILDELETALMQHPTTRMDINFRSRIEVILKRLSLRGNPASPVSLFPRPSHPLFPDQPSANDEVISDLCEELNEATTVARKAEAAAREYRELLQSVKRAEAARKELLEITTHFESIIERLERGVESRDGDGTPLDLSSEACLDPSKHAAFLVLLPSNIDELAKVDARAEKAVREAHAALLHLESPPVDVQFKKDAVAEIEACMTARERSRRLRDEVMARADRLRTARKVWSSMGETAQSLNTLLREVSTGMERDRWKQETARNDAPPTPDSDEPTPALDNVSVTSDLVQQRVMSLRGRITQEVSTPLANASSSPDTALVNYLKNHAEALNRLLSNVRSMNEHWRAVKEQAAVMTDVRREVHNLENQIDTVHVQLAEGMHDLLDGKVSLNSLPNDKDVATLSSSVSLFTSSLSGRIPFISRHNDPNKPPSKPGQAFSISNLLEVPDAPDLPFDLGGVDAAVRTDVNAYALRLSGGIASLEQKIRHIRLALVAKEIDGHLLSITGSIDSAANQLNGYRSALESIDVSLNPAQQLSELRVNVESLVEKQRLESARSFAPVRELIQKLETSPGINDPEVHDLLLVSRIRAADDAEQRFNALLDDSTLLKHHIAMAHSLASMSQEAGVVLGTTNTAIDMGIEQIARLRSFLEQAAPTADLVDDLTKLSAEIGTLTEQQRGLVEASLSSVRELLTRIEASPPVPGSPLRDRLLDLQTEALHQTEERLSAFVVCSTQLETDVDLALNLAFAEKEFESQIQTATSQINIAVEQLSSLRSTLEQATPTTQLMDDLTQLSTKVDALTGQQREMVEGSLSSARELLIELESSPPVPGSPLRERFLEMQTEALHQTEAQLNAFVASSSELKRDVDLAQSLTSTGMEFDSRLQTVDLQINSAVERLSRFRSTLEAAILTPDLGDSLTRLLDDVDTFAEEQSGLAETLLSAAGELTVTIESSLPVPGSTLRESLLELQTNALDNTRKRLDAFLFTSSELKADLNAAQGLVSTGKNIDAHLETTDAQINVALEQLSKHRATLKETGLTNHLTDDLSTLLNEVGSFKARRRELVESSLTSAHSLLTSIESSPSISGSTLRGSLLEVKSQALEERRNGLDAFLLDSSALQSDLSSAQTLSSTGNDIDVRLEALTTQLNTASDKLSTHTATFQSIKPDSEVSERLLSLNLILSEFATQQKEVCGGFIDAARELLRKIEASPPIQGSNIREALAVAKSEATDDAQKELDGFFLSLAVLKDQITASHVAATTSHEVKGLLHRVNQSLDEATVELSAFDGDLQAAVPSADLSSLLSELSAKVETFAAQRHQDITISLPALHEFLRKFDVPANIEESDLRKVLFDQCSEGVRMAETRLEEFKQRSNELQNRVTAAQSQERDRLERERLEEEARQQAERDRLEAEERTRLEQERLEAARLEKERQDAEEKARLERERFEAEERARLEKERLEAEERARLEKERLEVEERARVEQERLEAEERARLDKERQDAEERASLEREREEAEERARMERERAEAEKAATKQKAEKGHRRRQSKGKKAVTNEIIPEDDIFGPHSSNGSISVASNALLTRISALRKRLRSLSLHTIAHPSNGSNSALPSEDESMRLTSDLKTIADETTKLPTTTDEPTVQVALNSLREDIAGSHKLMQRIGDLATFSNTVALCDAALSDLLEHIDSYPQTPTGGLMASHVSDSEKPPEEQMNARLSFTEDSIDALNRLLTIVEKDHRAVTEHERVMQTWSELREMALDCVHGVPSQPHSAVSSGRESSASVVSSVRSGMSSKRTSSYGSLGRGGTPSRPPSQNRFLKPATPASNRRAVSDKIMPPRSVSKLSMASSRSTSGSVDLSRPTFASRQRTTSLSSTTSSLATPVRPTNYLAPHHNTARSASVNSRRIGSPTPSDTSSHSRLSTRSTSASHSTWSRAPRLSLGTPLGAKPVVPRTPVRPPPKKKYVANPKNKLDVAVGDVINKLSISINIEIASENWKDQSGKYWIGNQDPKLCFCRILRSQTVMVRVGGGWQELSSFIKGHFADSFRLGTESPPQSRQSNHLNEEKWISSASLLAQSPVPPKTPEPAGPFLPSFALSTPDGSPRSLMTGSSPGSPGLMPLQYLRRAELERPSTPSRLSHSKTPSIPNTPARMPPPTTPHRGPVWRP